MTNFDIASLHPQYITDESGNKMAIVLSMQQFEELIHQLTELSKHVTSLQSSVSSGGQAESFLPSPSTAQYSLVEQEIQLIKQHYDRISSLSSELQKYKDLQTELDRKLLFHRLTANLDAELQNIRSQLGELKKNTRPAPLYAVPDLPKHVIAIPSLLSEVKTKLLMEPHEGQRPPLLIEAPSGMGKSFLASLLAYDDEIRRTFPDGIFWIYVGKEPFIFNDQLTLIQTLENALPEAINIETINEYLKKLCATHACLVILDDVWDAQDILAFSISSEHSQLLVTTSDHNLLNITQYFIKNIQSYPLKIFQEKQAIDYFLRCLGKKELASPLLNDLVSMCEYLPAALKLVANLAQAQPITAWPALLNELKEHDNDFPEHHPHVLMQALHLNVQALGEQADYYLSLAVFTNYSNIPFTTLLMLWRYLYQLSEDQTNNFIKDTLDKGLLEIVNKDAQHSIRLHLYQYDYLCAETELEKLHGHLLATYRRQCGQHGWLSGPNDGYFFENLAKHLIHAGRKNELKLLLLDFDWIQKKLQLTTVYSLLQDYELLEDRDVDIVKKALYEAETILNRDKTELAVQLLNRLWEEKSLQNNKDIQALLNQAKETSPHWRWQPHFDEEEKKAKLKNT